MVRNFEVTSGQTLNYSV